MSSEVNGDTSMHTGYQLIERSLFQTHAYKHIVIKLCTVYCFLFTVKKFHVFRGLLGNHKTFLAKFCDSVHVNTVEAVNRESFSGNEGRNV